MKSSNAKVVIRLINKKNKITKSFHFINKADYLTFKIIFFNL